MKSISFGPFAPFSALQLVKMTTRPKRNLKPETRTGSIS